MASDAPDAGQPNLNLSREEKALYGHLFRQADSDHADIVMGDVAVKFFEKTRLDSRILGEIWQIADRENRGFLTPTGFGVALRLIGHAQAGHEPTPSLALRPGPLPQFEGVGVPAPLAPMHTGPMGFGAPTAARPLSAQGTGTAMGGVPSQLSPQGTGTAGGAVRVPPLAVEKAAQYAKVFQDQTFGAAILPGDRAKRIFEKSGLPNEVLGRIWQLADTEQRGGLVQTEFIIAMHLLTSTKLGAMRGLPNILPAGLYEAATRGVAASALASSGGPGSPIARQQSPLGAAVPSPGIPRAMTSQLTGQMRPPLAANFTGGSLGAGPRPPVAPPVSDWLITPAEKARTLPVFESLDKAKKGYITGEEAVPFLMRSGLPEDQLAQVWDLADVNSEGRLNSDTFAVALHLIQQQRQRTDGTNGLPVKLPLNLVPPSMRPKVPAVSPPPVLQQQHQPPPPPPPPPKAKSVFDDLFSLNDSAAATAPSVPALTATSTGAGVGAMSTSSLADPFAGSTSPIPPSSPTGPSSGTSTFKPFVPSSSFGRSLTVQSTGDSNGSGPSGSLNKSVAAPAAALQPAAAFPSPAVVQNDLLGDQDAEASRNLSNDTAELANLSNQIGSLSKHMQEVQTHHSTLQSELSQTSAKKKSFEQRLAQLRTLYEKEARDVRSLEDQLKTLRADTTKVQTEVATLDATVQDLQKQHAQLSAALQADQQENGNLKERWRVVNAEIGQLKPQIEKLKSEARQQKGIVAINRKQLSLGEAERDKLKTEAEELTRSNEELARQIHQSQSSATSATASPSVASSTGNNPFFRRTGSADIMGVFSSSPAPSASAATAGAKAYGDTSFDDVFGPMPTTSSPSSPPPTALAAPALGAAVGAVSGAAAAAVAVEAFKPQTTGASSDSGVSSTYTAPTAQTSGSGTPVVSHQPTITGAETSSASPPPQPLSAGSALSPPVSTASPSSFTTPPPASVSPTPAPAVIAAPAAEATAPAAAAETYQEAAPEIEAPATVKSADVSEVSAQPASSPFGVSAAPGVAAATAGIAAVAATAAADGEQEKVVWGHGHSDSLDDAFSSLDKQQPDHDKAKEDFESAFATFKAARSATTEPPASAIGDSATAGSAAKSKGDAMDVNATKAFASFSTEFPPISELEREESDSESEQGGFDDDFAPASPPVSQSKKPDTTPFAEGNGSSVTGTAPAPVAEKSTAAAMASDIFGAADLGSGNAPTATSSVPLTAVAAAVPEPAKESAASSSGFDDLDDEFEGLEDAREGSGDDEFGNISRSGFDDFSFDSPPPPLSQPAKTDSNLTGTATSSFGLDNSFDFSSLSTSTATPQNGSGTASKPINDDLDWFSLPSTTDNNNNGSSTKAPAAGTATAISTPGSTKLERPAAPGRALTDSGEHDDPILKKLTQMGYPRAMALNALEKYDYNVDRAANYLANQS